MRRKTRLPKKKIGGFFHGLKRRLRGKYNVSLVEKRPWGGYETKSRWFMHKETADRYAKKLAESVRGDKRYYVKIQDGLSIATRG